MANEQVRIDLFANDKASKVIDGVADDVAKLEKADPEIEISAADKASKMMADIMDGLDKLDAADPEITIDADNNASRTIADVASDADKLTAADHELVLKARIDAAKGELRALQSELEQTGDKAQQTERRLDDIGRSAGPGLAGNAVSDMTGPLGDVSGAASDIAGVFDGLGDVAANMAARVGMDAEKMAGAITGIGFAVTAAAAAWTFYRQKQAAAREKQAELVKGQRDFNKAVAEGDRVAAATQFADMYGDALSAAERAGVSINDVTRFITGQADAIPGLTAQLAALTAATEDHTGSTAEDLAKAQTAKREFQDLAGTIDNARDSYKQANGTLADQDRKLSQVASALGRANTATSTFARTQADATTSTESLTDALDRMRGELDIEQLMLDFKRDMIGAVETAGQSALDQQGDIVALKQTLLDTAEAFKKTPLEVQTELEKIDAGQLAQVARDVQAWYEQHPIILASKLDRPGQIVAGGSGGGGVGPRFGPGVDRECEHAGRFPWRGCVVAAGLVPGPPIRNPLWGAGGALSRGADRPVPVVTLDPVPVIAGWPVRPVFAIERSYPVSYWDSGPRVGVWDQAATIWDGGWRDATCSWTGCEIDTGEPDDAGLYPAARAVLQLDNADGSWSTLNADGTSSEYGPGRTLNIWAHNATGDWWLFSGKIARYDQRADDTIEIEAFDAFSDLAQPIGTYTPGVAAEKPGARLLAVLTAAGEAAIPHRFAVGVVALTRQETELAPLEEMQTVAASDGGVMFVDADGTIVSYDRQFLSGRTDQPTVPVVSYNVQVAELHIWDPVVSTNDAALADRVILENVAGLQATAAGTTTGYTLTFTEQQWTTQTEGDILAMFLYQQQSPRKARVESFDLYLNDPTQPTLWTAVDWRRLDKIRFLHDQKAVGGGLRRLDVTPLIDSIIHEITPDGWTMTVGTTHAQASPIPILYDDGHLYDDGSVYEY